jgi:peptidyl-prolyl cis-trans isomerase A (cyclophilin A)
MQQRFNASARTFSAVALTTVMLAALSACGGGGGNSATATVSTMSVANAAGGQPVYGHPVAVTVTGTNLSNLTLSAPGCKNVTRLTASPTASTDTTAYFSCTPSGAYSSTITAVSNGGTISTQPLSVPAPIVTMTVVGGGVTGSIVFNLKGDVAPITVDNFLAYVNSGFYTGLIFSRVAHQTAVLSGPEYFIVQGGGYGAATSGTLPTPKTPTFAPIALENGGGNNVQWTAAMARTQDANSATSQFFFNVIDNTPAFSNTYAVFADVSSSAALITQITQASCTELVGTGLTDGSCVPIPNVVITSATQTQ